MDAVESKHPVELPVLEERVRRDAGRSSLAIASLCGLMLLASAYAMMWLANFGNDKQKTVVGPPGPTIKTIDWDEAGRLGSALDFGDAPNANDDQRVEMPGEAADDRAKALLEAIAKQDFAERQNGEPGGAVGGPIAWNKDKDGPGPGRFDQKAATRWQVEWGDDTEVGYRRKLDFFGIYIGAVRGGKLIGAVRGFETRPRKTTDQPPATWFVHQEKRRVDVDRNLLKAAGVPVAATDIVAQFYPPELRATLTAVEAAHSNKNAKDIRKTVFGIRPAGGGYELYVIEQQVD
jgi:hypothetical protein